MSNQDYKKLFTEVIKKQIVLLGPAITLAKARNVKGLTILDDGTVSEISGNPQELIQALIDQFVQLSGLIVKKTMEPLLNIHSSGISLPVNPVIQVAQAQTLPVQPVAQNL
ncbi:MAG: hypothetical protein CO135_00345 [Candidatus Levybacteria bacterium CG_4_9_14_3_um_filter_35_16]|nr:MAG: hypothetical protein COW87_00980 [Candidatus Levybacteria bacterium CG22_combo_CG10-13_8_21_14_all_35_11]PIY95052.1 MAG: hypothetical protein COY68_00410 [Candidatus Levybacteria bacterium CG_4_10_14_0_8_um_filter_35_23]PIZ99157.1 MAG: hypothetical protein COX78_02215 [Candidatus Levybacteria bacterium CG_4_10_14_0_2_um_filter_35_8]PJA91595.1 MAG: hypothetical protein CO135_00345 [Candidatus Levybacteria bacterium CG_4_9_14_3_um_filter_35_16]PJC54021.1 MAG: hypothetical protein CO028_04